VPEWVKGIWWIIGAPALAYVLIEHTWHVETEAQQLLIGFLSLGGGMIYFIPRS
jgi:hypothetical protein